MKKKKYVSKKGKVKKKRKSALESSEEECKTHTGNTGQNKGKRKRDALHTSDEDSEIGSKKRNGGDSSIRNIRRR